MLNSPYQKYQQNSIQTATPAQLVIMLYDGAIRFTKQAIEATGNRRYDIANTNFIKAQSVIHELIASLNPDYPISKDLARIYEYMLHRLLQANLKKDMEQAREVLDHLEELRDAWKQSTKAQIASGGTR